MADSRWHPIICSCGSDVYERGIKLRWSETGGTAESLGPYRCASCRQPFDVQRFEREHRRKKLLLELEELGNAGSAEQGLWGDEHSVGAVNPADTAAGDGTPDGTEDE